MGMHKWYHNEPILQAFVNELGPQEAPKAFRQFVNMTSPTSPQTRFPQHVLNAPSRDMLQRRRKPLPPHRGEPPPEQTPYPYGMPPIARQNIENLWRTGALDPIKNPKPARFIENLLGNLQPGTMDTHAFRNVAMRTGDKRFLEGSISENFTGDPNNPSDFVKRFGTLKQDAEGKWKVFYNPRKLHDEGKLTMAEAKQIPTFWASKPNENEYKAVEELYRRLGAEHELRLPTADAQAAAWGGAGELTGLGSPPVTVPEVMNRRLEFTARMRGEDSRETLRKMIRAQAPLLTVGGAVALPALRERAE